MNILVLKDLGDPWDWVPAGCGQDHSVEERGGEKNFKKEAKLHLCKFVVKRQLNIFSLQISETGSYAELLAKRGDFSDFIVEQLQGTEEEAEEEEVKEVEALTKRREH